MATNDLNTHMEEAASRAGLSLSAAQSLQSQLENVSGVSGKRAVELLLMADFDVNRAVRTHVHLASAAALSSLCHSLPLNAAWFDRPQAEYYFTHPEDLQEAEAGPVITTPTAGGMKDLQQVEVRSSAAPGHAMTVLVVGRGEFSVVVPAPVNIGDMFQIALPALSLQSLNEDLITVQVKRPAKGFGVLLHHSKNRQVVEVDEVEAGSPAGEAGFQVHDVVVELAGVMVEGRVPQGLQEAMARVKALSAQGVDVFEWKLRRPPPQQAPPIDAGPLGSGGGGGDGSEAGAAESPAVSVVAAAVASSWGVDDDDDADMPGRGAGPTDSPTKSRLSEAEQEAVRQLVDAGAAALNSATEAVGFQRAMLKFDSALQLSPNCEEARYGKAQAKKALDFSAMASGMGDGSGGMEGRGMGMGAVTGDFPREAVSGYSAERTQPGALPIFRVVSGAKVRQGRETTSGLVRELEPGSEIEVLEMALDGARRVRLRGSEGWISVQAANGQLLLEECFHPFSTPQVRFQPMFITMAHPVCILGSLSVVCV